MDSLCVEGGTVVVIETRTCKTDVYKVLRVQVIVTVGVPMVVSVVCR